MKDVDLQKDKKRVIHDTDLKKDKKRVIHDTDLKGKKKGKMQHETFGDQSGGHVANYTSPLPPVTETKMKMGEAHGDSQSSCRRKSCTNRHELLEAGIP